MEVAEHRAVPAQAFDIRHKALILEHPDAPADRAERDRPPWAAARIFVAETARQLADRGARAFVDPGAHDLAFQPAAISPLAAVIRPAKIGQDSGAKWIFRCESRDRSREVKTELALRPISGQTERELLHFGG